MPLTLGQTLHLVFYDLEGDRYVVKSGAVTAIRGTKVQLAGLKGWHATEEWPPAFESREEAEGWVRAHPFGTEPKG